jgi:hypothetical protein
MYFQNENSNSPLLGLKLNIKTLNRIKELETMENQYIKVLSVKRYFTDTNNHKIVRILCGKNSIEFKMKHENFLTLKMLEQKIFKILNSHLNLVRENYYGENRHFLLVASSMKSILIKLNQNLVDQLNDQIIITK